MTSTAPQIPIEDIVGPAAEAAAQRARESGRPVLASVGIPVQAADPLSLIRGASPAMAGWWSRPGLVAAGTDVAFSLHTDGPARVVELADRLSRWFADAVIIGREPLAFAGCAFADAEPTGAWAGFPTATAWVPEVCAILDDDGSWLVAATPVLAGEAEAATEYLASSLTYAAHTLPSAGIVPQAAGIEPAGDFTPDDDAWTSAVADALTRIGASELTKVVLARRLRLPAGGDAWDTAVRLALSYPECFGYGISFGEATFIGASPELLIERRGSSVRSAPAAGTIAREATTGLGSEKERIEQGLVVEAVVDSLRPLCDELEAGAPRITAAGPVQHLSSEVTGRLTQPRHILELVAAVHPTPAVAGIPQPEALSFLRSAEGFDRGWYAGPVGIVTPDGDGEFALALRGALFHADGTDLYAGAGIVNGSEPDGERGEIALKLRAAAAALG
ncbi:MAG: isochorismate synthase [Actinomycetota bacterium]